MVGHDDELVQLDAGSSGGCFQPGFFDAFALLVQDNRVVGDAPENAFLLIRANSYEECIAFGIIESPQADRAAMMFFPIEWHSAMIAESCKFP